MRVRKDFLRAARGSRRTMRTLSLETSPTPEADCEPGSLRLGVTATKKIGGAVQRNRAKRRLRAAARAVLPHCGMPGNDYVLVARRDTLTTAYKGLVADLEQAVRAVHRGASKTRAPEGDPASGETS